ncbi:MAG: DNA internalization-related competence protein ComEC/Rec2 [Gemmatimonadota bacterium]|nr:DNA internalization-related competence protein ComEC/Rec2 [Gemmatimonadota bacterium]
MPLIAAAFISFAAGLLAGFGGAVLPAIALAAAAAGVARLRRDTHLAALALFVASGVATAAGRNAHDERCHDRALRATSWRVVLSDAARAGEYVRGRWEDGSCDLRAGLAVERGGARAGAVVVARGDIGPAGEGIIVRGASILETPERRSLIALRARSGSAIDRLFGVDAPLVRALLIADTRSLDPALRDRFAAAGLVHMLSISGLHVAIVAAAVELLMQAMRLRRTHALLAATFVTALYVAVIGAPAPAVRSGAMLAVVTACRLLGRATSPWAALAVGAWLPLLLDSRTVGNIGWQLSVIGIAALIASGALARRWIAPRLEGWRADVARTLLASAVATGATAPIVAWHFGQLSLVAPITNVLATPVIAVLQPALFLALVAAPIPAAGSFVADGSKPLLHAFDAIATAGAALPLASVGVTPDFVTVVLAGAAVAALLAACLTRYPARPLVAALAALAGAVWAPLMPYRTRAAELHLIDVGQGDAIALRTPRGRWILFDAGRAWRGGDDGRRIVVPYLRRFGGDVAAFVLSHPDNDHVGGAASVLRALRPGAFWDGAYVGGSDAYHAALREAEQRGIAWRRVRPGDSIAVDGLSVRFLAPDSAWAESLTDPNEASVVAIARYGAVRFLLVGDAESAAESWLVARDPDALRADVLKVGHHGSATSTSAPFLDAVRPRLALVSVGAGNTYGHPSAAVLRDLVAAGATVMRTDQMGSVVVRTDGRALRLSVEGDEWELARHSATP